VRSFELLNELFVLLVKFLNVNVRSKVVWDVDLDQEFSQVGPSLEFIDPWEEPGQDWMKNVGIPIDQSGSENGSIK